MKEVMRRWSRLTNEVTLKLILCTLWNGDATSCQMRQERCRTQFATLSGATSSECSHAQCRTRREIDCSASHMFSVKMADQRLTFICLQMSELRCTNTATHKRSTGFPRFGWSDSIRARLKGPDLRFPVLSRSNIRLRSRPPEAHNLSNKLHVSARSPRNGRFVSLPQDVAFHMVNMLERFFITNLRRFPDCLMSLGTSCCGKPSGRVREAVEHHLRGFQRPRFHVPVRKPRAPRLASSMLRISSRWKIHIHGTAE